MVKRIAHLTSVHPAHDTRIFVKQCKSLSKAGFEVTLFHPGSEKGDRDGVLLQGLDIKTSSRISRLLIGNWRLFRATLRDPHDCFHVHDPELLPLVALLRFLRRRVIYDAHEDLPAQLLTKPYLPGRKAKLASALLGRLERLLVRTSSAVVAATPGIQNRFGSKTCLVQNYPIVDEFETSRGEPSTSVVYLGGLTLIRGLTEMVEAIGQVQTPDVRLVLIGEFQSKEVEEQIQTYPHWQRVDHLGWQDRVSVGKALRDCVGGLAIFLPVPHHVESRPNKLFEYMAASLPVIASDFPAWREIVSPHRCGILVDPTDVRAIADAIDRLLADPDEAAAMGARGRMAVESIYNWDVEFQKLLELYESVLRRD